MASVNKVILIGNLGRDPELKYLPSGKAVCEFSIATTDRFKDSDGNQQERTEWHNIVLFGRQAEVAKEYLAKGRSVYIEGRIRNRSWDDKDGNKHYKSEVVGDRMQFLGSRGDSGGAGPSNGSQGTGSQGAGTQTSPSSAPVSEPAGSGGGGGAGDDDLPF